MLCCRREIVQHNNILLWWWCAHCLLFVLLLFRLLWLMLSDWSQLDYTSFTFFRPRGTRASLCSHDRHRVVSVERIYSKLDNKTLRLQYNTRLESPIPSAILEKVHSRNRNAWQIRHGESGVGGGPLSSDARALNHLSNWHNRADVVTVAEAKLLKV